MEQNSITKAYPAWLVPNMGCLYSPQTTFYIGKLLSHLPHDYRTTNIGRWAVRYAYDILSPGSFSTNRALHLLYGCLDSYITRIESSVCARSPLTVRVLHTVGTGDVQQKSEKWEVRLTCYNEGGTVS